MFRKRLYVVVLMALLAGCAEQEPAVEHAVDHDDPSPAAQPSPLADDGQPKETSGGPPVAPSSKKNDDKAAGLTARQLAGYIAYAWGWAGELPQPPKDAIKIGVVGKKWYHTAVYPGPDGKLWTADDLREQKRITVPEGTPIHITLRSDDVIHSLFIPQLRAKKDIVPGRDNTMLLDAAERGVYDFYCTEYCGIDHSTMIGKLHVVSEEEYLEHLKALGKKAGQD